MYGVKIPAAMGSAIATNFQPTGDFVMTADEVQPVLQALKEKGVQVMGRGRHAGSVQQPQCRALWGHLQDQGPRPDFHGIGARALGTQGSRYARGRQSRVPGDLALRLTVHLDQSLGAGCGADDVRRFGTHRPIHLRLDPEVASWLGVLGCNGLACP